MFRRLDNETVLSIEISFDGQQIQAAPGETVAVALLAAGFTELRKTPASGSPRSPFCMMGACYDCLVSIDGSVKQACMTSVENGLIINRVE